ncbi:Mrf1p [Ascoidea rubescens DSM 1968]|uniref:Peptide chain release factor 1, mitochondrial n=1 Tax=Ascoidea rubescens DSM 1968 TaxID=1344418 RepID=A0A1D2VD77_9ASCO|nr:release factor [Ascoidea rubescens DSM 1968]ODV59591.1 release factor [Ascoidea rubescens DSM 1968]
MIRRAVEDRLNISTDTRFWYSTNSSLSTPPSSNLSPQLEAAGLLNVDEVNLRLNKLNSSLFKKLESYQKDLESMQNRLSSGEILSVDEQKQFSKLSSMMELFQRYQKLQTNIFELNEMIQTETDPELISECLKELNDIYPNNNCLIELLQKKILPSDPDDEKFCLIEIRPGVGGEEAMIFASDLFNMYINYAKINKLHYEILSQTFNQSNNGLIEGKIVINSLNSYGFLKYESGVHRVQRVPKTENKGRVHTSTVAVIVLPKDSNKKVEKKKKKIEDPESTFKPGEVRIDVMRASGKGGQHVNTTDSAVRLTHLSTGVTVSIQDERSQHKNKAKAFRILRERLDNISQKAEENKNKKDRLSLVSTTDRSDKIRTYNFSQHRITDHRCGYSAYNIDEFLNGNLLDSLRSEINKKEIEDKINQLLKELEVENNNKQKD